LAKHPKFEDAALVGCTLAPGEMLYIPKGWWHYLRALEPSASVSFWWGP